MKKINETGHLVNANNFSRIIPYCETLGTRYAPPDSAIGVLGLKAKKVTVDAAMLDFFNQWAPWTMAVNGRGDVLDLVDPMMTRIKNIVNVCDVSDRFKADVESIVKKIMGIRISPKLAKRINVENAPEDDLIVQISASQQGVDNKIGNVTKLLALLDLEPKYTPSETELKLPALTAFLGDLNDANDLVSEKTPLIDNARIARNKELYEPKHGSNDLALKVKSYFKGAFGGDSKEYHSVAKYEFRKLVKL
ncbi:MAG: hypothetical protein WCQ95_04095 [Bacteroidota bacterium]